MGRKTALCLLSLGVLCVAGCSGGSFVSTSTSTQSSTITAVSASCVPTSVLPGQTSQCSATVAGTGSYNSGVNWSAASGTVTSAGLYTAPSSGLASETDTITATSTQDSTKHGSAGVGIGAAIKVNNIAVTATPSSIATALTSLCTANVTGTGSYSSAVTWTATGGTITQAGVFTPSGVGTGSCIATSTQTGYTNISGAASITIAPATVPVTVSAVTVVATPSSITSGQTATCVATVTGTGAYSSAVTWTATGGTITQAGVFKPSGAGTATCVAHSAQSGYTNITGSAGITITTTPPTVTKVSVTATPTSIGTSQTSQCTATVTGTGAYSSAVTWTATGGTITPTGLFTPSGAGTGTCTATSTQTGYTNVAGSASIAITSATFTITSISVAASPTSITTGQTSHCTATVSGTGTYSSAVTWTATGGSITSSGIFTPSGAGTATCTANSAVASYTNVSGSANIAVTTATPTVTGVTLTCSPTSITTTQTATCTPTVTGTGAFANTVSLSISPSGGGTLSSSSAVASGTPVTFTPPSTAETATITAVSTQDSTKTSATTVAVTLSTGAPTCGGLSLGNGASLNGLVPFPSSNAWNTDISNAPVDPNNAAITSAVAFAGDHLHHDWSSINGGDYGIPFVVVDSTTQPMVPISVIDYATESDVAEAPFPANAPIEGSPADCTGGPGGAYTGDQHILVLDRNTCMLYETFNTVRCNGAYTASSETIWDLKNYEQRPWGWTSADAAGLPIFPGLVRYDEVASGAINHALRFTMDQTKNDANNGYWVEPATHASGTNWSTLNVIGMRIRLKPSFDISGFSAANQVILTAMKKYGMILADNGSSFYFQGAPDSRWNDDDLSNLDSVTSDNFEVVQMTPTYPGWDAATAPTGAAPTINSFTSSASTVAAGTPVTLSWSTTNDSYDFIDKLGGVRGPSVTITPTATTTYTLNATNQYGRSTAQVTVVVQ